MELDSTHQILSYDWGELLAIGVKRVLGWAAATSPNDYRCPRPFKKKNLLTTNSIINGPLVEIKQNLNWRSLDRFGTPQHRTNTT